MPEARWEFQEITGIQHLIVQYTKCTVSHSAWRIEQSVIEKTWYLLICHPMRYAHC